MSGDLLMSLPTLVPNVLVRWMGQRVGFVKVQVFLNFASRQIVTVCYLSNKLPSFMQKKKERHFTEFEPECSETYTTTIICQGPAYRKHNRLHTLFGRSNGAENDEAHPDAHRWQT